MSDIFISYARKDIDFAGKIVQALAENDLDTWIDWKSIPKGEDWGQEIYRGIEEADAFLFLISPDSVMSEMCNKEIAHAVKNGKRILPIFISNVEDKEVNSVTGKFLTKEAKEEINRRNFIFAREERDDLKKAIDEIRTTIHTDYEWLKYHTELQVKALKWKQQEDNTSRLLRGKELQDAEQQLANSGIQKDPQPTTLQRQYHLKSRQYASYIRRIVAWGSIGVALIMVLLSVVAWQQRNSALEAQAEAERQARIALGRQLAAQSENQLIKGNDDLALLLSIESGRAAETSESFIALHKSIARFATSEIALQGHKDSIHLAAWTADESRILTASDDGTARVWNAHTGEEQIVLRGHVGSVNQAIWNTDEGRILTAGHDGTVRMWDAQTGEQLLELAGHTGPILDATWNSDESRIVGISEDETINIWDSQTGNVLLVYSNQKAQWNLDKSRILTIDSDGKLNVWETETGKNLLTFRNDIDSIVHATWNPDGGQILTVSESGVAQILDINTGRTVTTLVADPNDLFYPNQITLKHASWDPSGGRILIVTAFPSPHLGNTVQVWNAQDGQRILRLDGHFGNASWNNDGSQILTFGGSDSRFFGEPQIWNSQNGKELATLSKYPYLGNDAYDVWTLYSTWSKDGNLILSVGNNNAAWVWDANSGDELAVLSGHTDQINNAYWSADQGHVLTVSADFTARIWNLKSTYELPVIESTQMHAKLSPDATKFLTYGNN